MHLHHAASLFRPDGQEHSVQRRSTPDFVMHIFSETKGKEPLIRQQSDRKTYQKEIALSFPSPYKTGKHIRTSQRSHQLQVPCTKHLRNQLGIHYTSKDISNFNEITSPCYRCCCEVLPMRQQGGTQFSRPKVNCSHIGLQVCRSREHCLSPAPIDP